MKVKCPQCQKNSTLDASNTYRPFCSERCRLIDLGEWAEESYRVPVEIHTPDLEEELQDELESELEKRLSPTLH